MTVREENLIELAPLLGREALAMQRIARSLHRLSEAQCNGFQDRRGNWDEAAELRAEQRSSRLEQRAQDIASEHGLGVYVQGDPRGWPLYLYRLADLRERDIESFYSSIGTAVCPR